MKYRHGDVILLEPVELPPTAKRKATKIVAEGEVTGHAHRLSRGSLWEDGGQLFLTAIPGANLTHEEHAKLKIARTAPGMAHPVIIQREYDDEQEWRKVAD